MTKRLWCYKKPSFSIHPANLAKGFVSQVYLNTTPDSFTNSLVYNSGSWFFSNQTSLENQFKHFQIKKIAV